MLTGVMVSASNFRDFVLMINLSMFICLISVKNEAAYRENDRPLLNVVVLYTMDERSHGFMRNRKHHHQYVYILLIIVYQFICKYRIHFLKNKNQAAFKRCKFTFSTLLLA
jgi:hypothetical protein